MTVIPPMGLSGRSVADRYTLPAELGGGEVETFAAPQFAPLPEGYSWMVTVEGRVVFPAPVALLTPVKPPLPPEPPDGSVVQIKREDYRAVFERDDEAAGTRPHWFGTDDTDPHPWERLAKLAEPGVPVLLVPDPFAEPVQLPYSTSEFTVSVSQGGRKVEFGYRDVFRQWVTPERTRELARAVWAAANQADKEDHE